MALNSFFSGLSGLNSQSTAINVVGDNLANLNTVGFKANTVRFSDLVNQGSTSATGNPLQQGLGSRVANVSPLFEQGILQTTGSPLDVALDGKGFFVTSGGGETHYTRAGNFSFTANGDLVAPNGDLVLGWQTRALDGSIPPTGAPQPINIPVDLTVPPKATGLLAMGFNLDANAAVGDSFSTGVTVYDSLGASHVLDMSFTKTGTGTWSYDVTIDGGEVSGGTAGTPVSIATGTLQFDASGHLDAATGVNGGAPADVAIGASAALTNGALPLSFTWDLVASDGTSPVSGYAAPSVVLSASQDGNAPGDLTGIQVDAGGVIVGRFSNGQTLDLARLSVAAFRNPEGLQRLGGNAFGATRASGEPVVGEAGAGGRGAVMGGTLEMSNVDIAEQFTSLIIAQRGYQASARVINTTDELTQEAINLKR